MNKVQLEQIVKKHLVIGSVTWWDEKYSDGEIVVFPGTDKVAARWTAFGRTQEAIKNACYPIQKELEALGYEARTLPHSAKRGDGRRVPKIEIYIKLKASDATVS